MNTTLISKNRLAYFVCSVFLVVLLSHAVFPQEPEPKITPGPEPPLNAATTDCDPRTAKTEGGKAVYLPKAKYPSSAQSKFKGGEVFVRIFIDELGLVSKAVPISGDSMFYESVEAAALLSQFTPFLKCGYPTAVTKVLRFNFWIPGVTDIPKQERKGKKALSLESSDLKIRDVMPELSKATPKLLKAYRLFVAAKYTMSDHDEKSQWAALKQLKEALRLYESESYPAGQGAVESTIGYVNFRLGKFEDALLTFESSISKFDSTGDKKSKARMLNNIGAVTFALGRIKESAAHYLSALPLLRETGDKWVESMTLYNIGLVEFDLGKYESSIKRHHAALELRRSLQDSRGEAQSLNAIGSVYLALGQNGKALELFTKALELSKDLGDPYGVSMTRNYIGAAHFAIGNFELALESFKSGMELRDEIGDDAGKGRSLTNIGSVYFELGQGNEALRYLEEALPLLKSSASKKTEAMALRNIGLVHLSKGQYEQAQGFLIRALHLQNLLTNVAGQAETLKQLMYLSAKSGLAEVAAFYGKQAVNKFQDLRESIRGLEREVQISYLGKIEDTYRRLAEILISEGRIVEAEQVLRMLKEEEVFDYLRRERSDASDLAERADLTPQEAEALRRYNEIADRITELGSEFGKLQDLVSKGVKLSTEQEARYKELSEKIEDASRVFQVFLRQLAEEFAKKPNTESDVSENLALQSDLKSWGNGLVFVYTLAGEDRFRSIVVTPDTQTNRKYEISSKELNRKISAFREAVRDPSVDPRPLGKELYDIIIAPIEKDLEGAGAKTILWSLDGNLRLLPMGALWDGEKYFAEKYRNVLVTLASRTRLGDAVAPDWRALGLGVSEGQTVTDPEGTRNITFEPLPAVPEELAAIVKSESSPKGVLPGESFLNSRFSEEELKRALLKNYKVIHIASHFSLNAGDSTKSFLLLGDGDVLTVDEIKNNPELRFNGVELLTLSACQTAVTGKDSTGKEIEGFGYVAQRKGAKAILATLWSVEDESTRLLMAEFYRLRNENPGMTKAEALQAAQLKMIRGEIKGSSAADGRGVDKAKKPTGKAPAFTADPDAPYSHPYFWSPFVLIGNWK